MFLITDQVLQRSLFEGVFKGLVQMNQSFSKLYTPIPTMVQLYLVIKQLNLTICTKLVQSHKISAIES